MGAKAPRSVDAANADGTCCEAAEASHHTQCKEQPPHEHRTHRQVVEGRHDFDAAAVQAIPAIDGAVRTIITITVAGRTVSADLATKSIRKAHITLAEHGLNGVVCVLQGKLQGDNTLADAGLAAQVKAQPVAAHSPAAEKAAA